MSKKINISHTKELIKIEFKGILTLYNIDEFENKIGLEKLKKNSKIEINLSQVSHLDTAFCIYLNRLMEDFRNDDLKVEFICKNTEFLEIISMVKKNLQNLQPTLKLKELNMIEKIGLMAYNKYLDLISFLLFMKELFFNKYLYIRFFKNIRFKEILYEVNENAIKAIGIIALVSFLIGLVIAYQSAYQLKIYGANIFIVDMIGISILRELAPLMTAIVIAGRSGSAFSAQIGSMKITEELDAMKTMGFDPYIYLILPRIIALMITIPLLIFIADIMGILGGMIVSNASLDISPELFLNRFLEVVAIKHFYIGLFKGPFFAFFIATIGIYRGMMVKNNTQSIGLNTTKAVVESIFAVIVCDAIFSIIFTGIGI